MGAAGPKGSEEQVPTWIAAGDLVGTGQALGNILACQGSRTLQAWGPVYRSAPRPTPPPGGFHGCPESPKLETDWTKQKSLAMVMTGPCGVQGWPTETSKLRGKLALQTMAPCGPLGRQRT